MTVPTTAESPARVDTLHASDVAELVQASAWPSVTLLLNTTPAERMLSRDAERLQGLLRSAERQLAAHDVEAAEVRRQLRSAVASAGAEATGRGLAVFVSQAVQRTFRLPVPVTPRAVVERTFRTRDLVQTLHRTPPHLLLILQPTCAQLYRGYADTLVPLPDTAFPVQHALSVPGELADGTDRMEEFVRRVDEALGHARRDHPAPIIVTGHADHVGRLVARSRNLTRLAGVITGPGTLTTPELAAAARASLAEYLLSREEEALLVLEEAGRDRGSTVHSGIKACWKAAHASTPKTLLVEERYAFPAVVDTDGIRRLDWLRNPEHTPPGGRVDLVDDLIEVVIDRGGWVAFTRNDQLVAHSRVALITSS